MSELMSGASDVRMGLLRRKVSYREFAESCGISEIILRAQLDNDVLSDEVLNGYASLEVEGKKDLAPKQRKCWTDKEVRNEYVMMVKFEDGSSGLVRKKSDFKPKAGMEMEVEESDESGVWRLVGKYRKNGVRLDAEEAQGATTEEA